MISTFGCLRILCPEFMVFIFNEAGTFRMNLRFGGWRLCGTWPLNGANGRLGMTEGFVVLKSFSWVNFVNMFCSRRWSLFFSFPLTVRVGSFRVLQSGGSGPWYWYFWHMYRSQSFCLYWIWHSARFWSWDFFWWKGFDSFQAWGMNNRQWFDRCGFECLRYFNLIYPWS